MRIKTGLILTLAPLMLALAGCGGGGDGNSTTPSAQVSATPAPTGQDWTMTVVKTPEGGFRMGNPDAPIKLVEFASMTCSHCAEFAEKGMPALKANYIASGKVSLEFRNFVRDSVDLTASLLARCGGEGPFFALTEQMLAAQPEWIARLQTPEAQQVMQGATPKTLFTLAAQVTQLDQFARQRGIAADKASACLADTAEAEKLAKGVEESQKKYGITGTPTFLINDKVVPNAAAWEALEPALKAAGG